MIATIQKSIISNWSRPAFSDYKGDEFLYSDVAAIISHSHARFKAWGLERGDKVAICGTNSARWAIAYLAAMTYGAVPVPILNDFTTEQTHNIVNHSEAKILYASRAKYNAVDKGQTPQLEQLLCLDDISTPTDRNIRPDDVEYSPETSHEDVAMINYTSGTTGFSKGVLIPYRAMLSNIEFAEGAFGKILKEDSTILALLPMAHMYGMMVEFLYQFVKGTHVYFLTRMPSPSILARAFAEVKPRIVFAVPLVLEKIVRNRIMPELEKSKAMSMIKVPIAGHVFKRMMRQKAMEFFGGNLYQVMTGGVALNSTTEEYLLSIGFPLAVGYGTTECAPMITYSDRKKFRPGSCGQAVCNMKIRIDSDRPDTVPGEILVKGKNMMLGYNKNPEATKEALDERGWYHTGDLGVMDRKGYLYISGRKKNMIVGPSGQNIYPEELENRLNGMPYVTESLIVQRNNKLVALIYPNYDEAYEQGLNDKKLYRVMQKNCNDLNNMSASYEQITDLELQNHEFVKTPKRSIKRYLYK